MLEQPSVIRHERQKLLVTAKGFPPALEAVSYVDDGYEVIIGVDDVDGSVRLEFIPVIHVLHVELV